MAASRRAHARHPLPPALQYGTEAPVVYTHAARGAIRWCCTHHICVYGTCMTCTRGVLYRARSYRGYGMAHDTVHVRLINAFPNPSPPVAPSRSIVLALCPSASGPLSTAEQHGAPSPAAGCGAYVERCRRRCGARVVCLPRVGPREYQPSPPPPQRESHA